MDFRRHRKLGAIFVAAILAACADGDATQGNGFGPGPPPVIAVGQFKDANVTGLEYFSGDKNGVTGDNGSFDYEVGNDVHFSVGAIDLGAAKGQSVITPLDLVAGGSTSSVEVLNRARFLLMLDEDGDSSNGIVISENVQTRAATWSQVDFSTADLPTALASIIGDAQSADGGTHVLPDAPTAQAHLEGTVLCSRSGAFVGTFNGDDHGRFGALISAADNSVLALVFSTDSDELFTTAAQTPVSLDHEASFTTGITDGPSYAGNLTSVDTLAGDWTNTGSKGKFTGVRMGGAADALYRGSAAFDGSDDGLYSFDVDESGAVTGLAYSVAHDTLLELAGTVVGTQFDGAISNGTTLTGTIDAATGAISGTWTDTLGGGGNFTGDGCALN